LGEAAGPLTRLVGVLAWRVRGLVVRLGPVCGAGRSLVGLGAALSAA